MAACNHQSHTPGFAQNLNQSHTQLAQKWARFWQSKALHRTGSFPVNIARVECITAIYMSNPQQYKLIRALYKLLQGCKSSRDSSAHSKSMWEKLYYTRPFAVALLPSSFPKIAGVTCTKMCRPLLFKNVLSPLFFETPQSSHSSETTAIISDWYWRPGTVRRLGGFPEFHLQD